MCKQNSWSEQYKFRREVAARFGRVFALPLARRVRDVLTRPSCATATKCLKSVQAIARMSEAIAKKRRGVSYRSMDLDPHGAHDYRTLEEIDRALRLRVRFRSGRARRLRRPGRLVRRARAIC